MNTRQSGLPWPQEGGMGTASAAKSGGTALASGDLLLSGDLGEQSTETYKSQASQLPPGFPAQPLYPSRGFLTGEAECSPVPWRRSHLPV